MRSFLLLCISLILFGCTQRETSDIENYDLALPDTSSVDTANIIQEVPPVPKTHYGFIVFVTEEPVFFENGYIQRGKKRYVNEIQEISDSISEDYKYREMDTAESELRDAELDDVETKYKSLAEAHKIDPSTGQINIVDRDMPIFDTYKEASIKRQEILNDKTNN